MLLALFFSLALADYCQSGPTTTVDSNLGPVLLVGANGTAINDTTDCPGKIGVQDLTYEKAILESSKTYTISFTATTCGESFAVTTAIWIDFNMNQMFESTELMYTVQGYGKQSFSFKLPDIATTLGATRMRVQTQETSSTTLDPCASFPYGGTKDFTVIIDGVPGEYCPSGPTTSVDTNLGAVYIAGSNSTVINDTSNCPGVIGVQDLTYEDVTLVIGSGYTITFAVTTCGQQFNVATAIWIDYNQNYLYESNELVYNVSGYGQKQASFNVPEGPLLGDTRMRVQSQENGVVPLNPCSQFPYGGTKDFGITIVNSSPPVGEAEKEKEMERGWKRYVA